MIYAFWAMAAALLFAFAAIINLYARIVALEGKRNMSVKLSDLLTQVSAAKTARQSDIDTAKTAVTGAIESAAANGQDLTPLQTAIEDYDAAMAGGFKAITDAANATLATVESSGGGSTSGGGTASSGASGIGIAAAPPSAPADQQSQAA